MSDADFDFTFDPILAKKGKSGKKLGVFFARKRNFRDSFRIGAEYSRLTEGIKTPTDALDLFATAYAEIKILVVKAPDDFDLDDLDPYDGDSYAKLALIHKELRVAEARFRQGGTGSSQPAG